MIEKDDWKIFHDTRWRISALTEAAKTEYLLHQTISSMLCHLIPAGLSVSPWRHHRPTPPHCRAKQALITISIQDEHDTCWIVHVNHWPQTRRADSIFCWVFNFPFCHLVAWNDLPYFIGLDCSPTSSAHLYKTGCFGSLLCLNQLLGCIHWMYTVCARTPPTSPQRGLRRLWGNMHLIEGTCLLLPTQTRQERSSILPPPDRLKRRLILFASI